MRNVPSRMKTYIPKKISESRGIQPQHVRRYESGKATIVNKGVKKEPIKGPMRQLPPRAPPHQAPTPPPLVSMPKREPISKGKMSEKDFMIGTMGPLFFPTMVWPGYESDVPREMAESLRMNRFFQAMKNPEEFKVIASVEEAVPYLMTASLVHPFDSHWAHIYLYAATQYAKSKGTELPADIKVEKLDNYEQSMLNGLLRWIRKKQIERLMEKTKGEKPKEDDTYETQ